MVHDGKRGRYDRRPRGWRRAAIRTVATLATIATGPARGFISAAKGGISRPTRTQ